LPNLTEFEDQTDHLIELF